MSNKSPIYNLPPDFYSSPFDNKLTNALPPDPQLMSDGYIFRQSLVGSPEHNFIFNASTALIHLCQQLGLFLPFNPNEQFQSIVATPNGGCVSMIGENGETTFWTALTNRPIGHVAPDLDLINWKQIKFKNLEAPAGSVIYFAGESAPDGFLIADGAQLSRSIYFELFAAIGVTYGNGDGSATFNLPNLLGEFIRCQDNGRGIDPGRVLGSSQDGTKFPALSIFSASPTSGRLVSHPVSSNSGYPNNNTAQNSDSEIMGTTDQYLGSELYAGGSTSLVAFTARPRNIALLPIIKY